ncbi:MAG: monovalent cation/H+ antiporter complex subunit F [Bacteroidota bacterium]
MFNVVLNIAIGLLILTFIISMIRLLKGPTLQDRVIALDMIGIVVIGIVIIFMIMSEKTRYLDVVIILSIILFLGTTAVGSFLNKEKK